MRLRGRGIHRIPRAGPTAAVARTICAAPAVMGCSIASPLSKGCFACFGVPDQRPGHLYFEIAISGSSGFSCREAPACRRSDCMRLCDVRVGTNQISRHARLSGHRATSVRRGHRVASASLHSDAASAHGRFWHVWDGESRVQDRWPSCHG
jgi:hypothetical protein